MVKNKNGTKFYPKKYYVVSASSKYQPGNMILHYESLAELKKFIRWADKNAIDYSMVVTPSIAPTEKKARKK
jgi:hypothetical protein